MIFAILSVKTLRPLRLMDLDFFNSLKKAIMKHNLAPPWGGWGGKALIEGIIIFSRLYQIRYMEPVLLAL